MTAALEPLAVLDVDDRSFWPPPSPGLEQLQGWLRAHGIEPNDTFRIEVFLLDCPFARVFQFDQDSDGRRFLKPGTRDEIATRKPFDVAISSMPPVGMD